MKVPTRHGYAFITQEILSRLRKGVIFFVALFAALAWTATKPAAKKRATAARSAAPARIAAATRDWSAAADSNPRRLAPPVR